MNAQSDAVPDARVHAEPIASESRALLRPLYWSVRRELWENRSIYIAPLAAAAVVLFGVLISMVQLPHKMRYALTLEPWRERAAISQPYSIVAFLLMVTAFLTGVFYSLDALYGERRDRSILFWKSLPVSDVTAVLAKTAVPVVVLPLVIFPITVVLHVIMLLMGSAVLQSSGISPEPLWTQLKIWEAWIGFAYALVALALWHAPIYTWLLLISGWVRRAAFVWAVLPLLLICAVENIAFHTTHFASFLRYRLIGWLGVAFHFQPPDSAPAHPLSTLAPGQFLSSAGLWTGLLFAAVFLAAAVRQRRYRGPL